MGYALDIQTSYLASYQNAIDVYWFSEQYYPDSKENFSLHLETIQIIFAIKSMYCGCEKLIHAIRNYSFSLLFLRNKPEGLLYRPLFYYLMYDRYVVKTLDNAESVKLQYRSLAKVLDDSPPSNVIQNKSITPSWLWHHVYQWGTKKLCCSSWKPF